LQEELSAKVLPEDVASFLEMLGVQVPYERVSVKKSSVYLHPCEWERLSAYHSPEALAVNIIGGWWFRKTS
jgi:hypothetical protein